MADNKLEILVEVDGQKAKLSLEQLKEGLKQVGDTAQASSGGISTFQARLLSLDAATNLVGKGFRLLQAGVRETFQALDRAQAVEGLSRGFETLQASIGNTAGPALQGLRSATKGLVADFELMQSANQAVLLGVDQGGQAFQGLAADAVKLGQAMGITAKEALDSLVVGIGRGSKLVLDNLGILVDAEGAYKRYAASIKKSVEALTEEDKKLAFQKAAFQAVSESAKELSESKDTAAAAATRLTAQVSNLIDQVVTAASENDDLREAVQRFSDVISNIDVAAFSANLSRLAGVFLDLAANVTEAANQISLFADQYLLARQAAKKADAEYRPGDTEAYYQKRVAEIHKELEAERFRADELSDIESRIRKVQASIRSADDQKSFDVLLRELTLIGARAHDSGNATEKLVGRVNDLADKVKEANKAFAKNGVSLKEYERRLKGAGSGNDEASKKTKKLQQDLESLTRTVAKATNFDQFPQLTRQVKDAFSQEATLGAQAFNDKLLDIASSALRAGVPLQDINDILRDQRKAADDASKAFDDFFEKTAREAVEKIRQQQEEIKNALGGGLEGILAKGIFTLFEEGTVDQAGSARILAEAVAGSVSQAAGLLADGKIGKDEFDELGNAVGTTIGAAIGAYVSSGNPGVTAAAGQVGGILGTVIGSLFQGSDSAATKARKSADAFFADIFEENRLIVVIDGKLKRIRDLTFDHVPGIMASGPQSTAFFDALFKLPPGIQESFTGVGFAFEQLLGIGQDIGGQLAAVIANNIGGSLNNLQLFVQATGKSFKDLKGLILDAFLAGNITIDQMYQSLTGLDKLMQKGIPDGVGQVKQAFENLINAGKKGGAASVDAIRDIAYEANELGLKTFPQVIDYLIHTAGQAPDQVAKLFEAMQAAGITSLEQLATASTERIAHVLGILSQMGFAFKETESQGADATQTVEDLPEEKSFTYRMKVEGLDQIKEAAEAAQSLPSSSAAQAAESTTTRVLGRSGNVIRADFGGARAAAGKAPLKESFGLPSDQDFPRFIDDEGDGFKSSGGGSRNSSSGARSSQSSKPAPKKTNFFEQIVGELRGLVQGSEQYASILDRLKSKEIGKAAAQRQLNDLYSQGRRALVNYEKAEERLEKVLSNPKAKRKDLLDAELGFKRAQDALEKYKTAIGAADDEIQKLNLAIPVRGLSDAITQLDGNKDITEFIQSFGDDLSKMALAAQAAGLSLADVNGSVEKSFLAGKISAQEAAKAFAENEDAFSGASQTVEGAYKKLLSAGLKGGAVSVQALKGIFAAAKKEGIADIGTVQERLKEAGLDSEGAIATIFKGLYDNQITALDDVQNLSVSAAASIISSMSDAGAAFGQTSDETSKLLEDLDKLRELKFEDKKLRVNIELIGPDGRILDPGNVGSIIPLPGGGDVAPNPTNGQGQNRRTKPNRNQGGGSNRGGKKKRAA